jgi:hypothetical protein
MIILLLVRKSRPVKKIPSVKRIVFHSPMNNNEPLKGFVYHQKRFLAASAYFDLIKKRISLGARAAIRKLPRERCELRGSVCSGTYLKLRIAKSHNR